MDGSRYVNVQLVGGAIIRLTGAEYVAALRRARAWMKAIRQVMKEAEEAEEAEEYKEESNAIP